MDSSQEVVHSGPGDNYAAARDINIDITVGGVEYGAGVVVSAEYTDRGVTRWDYPSGKGDGPVLTIPLHDERRVAWQMVSSRPVVVTTIGLAPVDPDSGLDIYTYDGWRPNTLKPGGEPWSGRLPLPRGYDKHAICMWVCTQDGHTVYSSALPPLWPQLLTKVLEAAVPYLEALNGASLLEPRAPYVVEANQSGRMPMTVHQNITHSGSGDNNVAAGDLYVNAGGDQPPWDDIVERLDAFLDMLRDAKDESEAAVAATEVEAARRGAIANNGDTVRHRLQTALNAVNPTVTFWGGLASLAGAVIPMLSQ